MEERNSEAKPMWLVVIMSIVIPTVCALADNLLQAHVLDQWPAVVAIVGGLIAAAAAAGLYAQSRPAKTLAVTNRAIVAAQLENNALPPAQAPGVPKP